MYLWCVENLEDVNWQYNAKEDQHQRAKQDQQDEGKVSTSLCALIQEDLEGGESGGREGGGGEEEM